MSAAEPMIYVMLTAYVVYIVLGIVLAILIARLLVALTRFVGTLNDYWRMRAASQFHAGQDDEK